MKESENSACPEQIELVVGDIVIMVSDSRAMGRPQARHSWESDHEEILVSQHGSNADPLRYHRY